MLGTWLFLLAIALALWLWMDALSARERAIAFGRGLCRDAGVQLLDQTVSMTRVRIQRVDGLPTLVRRYTFEISLDGSDRHPADHRRRVGVQRISPLLPMLGIPPAILVRSYI